MGSQYINFFVAERDLLYPRPEKQGRFLISYAIYENAGILKNSGDFHFRIDPISVWT